MHLLWTLIVGVICLQQSALCAKWIPMFEPLSNEMIHYVNHGTNTTWKAKPSTRFRTTSDIRRMLGALPDPNRLELPQRCSVSTIRDPELPESFDARNKWMHCPSIAEIRDQSSCGSCWAFGAVEAMSDRICIATEGKSKPLLSAENLVACCGDCGMGCDGGFPAAAWRYWRDSGIVTGDLYGTKTGCQPYSFEPCEHHRNGSRHPCGGDVKTPKCHHTCQPEYEKSYNNDKWYGKTVYKLPADSKAIMRELMTYGPMEVDFEVYGDFVSYDSGVYEHTAGALLGGHAVRLLGWGVEHGVDYWLIANSWNTDWGEEGYFKIRRGTNECGIESGVHAGLPLVPN